jgi:hypothetical protein
MENPNTKGAVAEQAIVLAAMKLDDPSRRTSTWFAYG